LEWRCCKWKRKSKRKTDSFLVTSITVVSGKTGVKNFPVSKQWRFGPAPRFLILSKFTWSSKIHAPARTDHNSIHFLWLLQFSHAFVSLNLS
jgi:hypothetical protein